MHLQFLTKTKVISLMIGSNCIKKLESLQGIASVDKSRGYKCDKVKLSKIVNFINMNISG